MRSTLPDNREEATSVHLVSTSPGVPDPAVRAAVGLLSRLLGRRAAWAAHVSDVPASAPLIVLGPPPAASVPCVVLPVPRPGAHHDPSRPWAVRVRRPGGAPIAFRGKPEDPGAPAGATPWLPSGYAPEDDRPPLTANGSAVRLHWDLVGDTVYLLSVGEERGAEERDRHGRFPLSASERGAAGLVRHPLVHYYAELLREMLRGAGFTDGWPDPRPRAVLSHDVDNVSSRHWRVAAGRLARIIGHLGRGSAVAAGREAARLLASQLTPNRWWTFPRIREIERRHRALSTFYFLGGPRGRYGPRYRWERPAIRRLMSELAAEGCVVGLHMGYDALGRAEAMESQRRSLEAALGRAVSANRSHYLRFRVPDSWRHLGEAGFTYDSTLGYAETEGFRAGVAAAYRPHDPETGSPLPVVELPLVAMDSCLFESRGRAEVVRDVLALAERLRLTNSALTLLWHARGFSRGELGEWGAAYEEILEALPPMGYGFATDREVVEELLEDEAAGPGAGRGRREGAVS